MRYKATGWLYYFDLLNSNDKLKTTSSYRLIPLHNELLKIGLLYTFNRAIKVVKRSTIVQEFSGRLK